MKALWEFNYIHAENKVSQFTLALRILVYLYTLVYLYYKLCLETILKGIRSRNSQFRSD